MFKFVVLLALLAIVVVSTSDETTPLICVSIQNAKKTAQDGKIIYNYPIKPSASASEDSTTSSSSVVSFVAALAILSAAF
ncbi:hypothetical protein PMAYCL1PPCAC_13139 [Pristionchus mayeri]|uniref:Uncharacterized protein n=1 Tax=Pristionchus mayeri TaxID=1317129 RepID=A0AAN4ZP96_9BILA|nr:hypothetical protein PMAYCL1PPCAC_13139 [Pristionchus mayeri]